MNKTYIKRQLTLNKLGFPMNKDIQEYVDLFNELIGNPDSLTKEYGEYMGNREYLYSKNGINLLIYDGKNEEFYVDYHNIWKKFKEKFGLNSQEIRNLLTPLLEEAFKCRATTTLINFIVIHQVIGGSFQM